VGLAHEANRIQLLYGTWMSEASPLQNCLQNACHTLTELLQGIPEEVEGRRALQAITRTLQQIEVLRDLSLSEAKDSEARVALGLWQAQLRHVMVSDALGTLPEVIAAMWMGGESEVTAHITALEALREVAFAQHPPLHQVAEQLEAIGQTLQQTQHLREGSELLLLAKAIQKTQEGGQMSEGFLEALRSAHSVLGEATKCLLGAGQVLPAAEALRIRGALWNHEADYAAAAARVGEIEGDLAPPETGGLGAMSESAAEAAFDLLDVNGDGVIDRCEFEEGAQLILSKARLASTKLKAAHEFLLEAGRLASAVGELRIQLESTTVNLRRMKRAAAQGANDIPVDCGSVS